MSGLLIWMCIFKSIDNTSLFLPLHFLSGGSRDQRAKPEPHVLKSIFSSTGPLKAQDCLNIKEGNVGGFVCLYGWFCYSSMKQKIHGCYGPVVHWPQLGRKHWRCHFNFQAYSAKWLRAIKMSSGEKILKIH